MAETAPAQESPEILADWLQQARTGGVRLVEGDGSRLVPWQAVRADVTRVAEYLLAAGVIAGRRVGIRGVNSYEWLVLDLALLQIGAVPVAVPVADFKGHANEALMRQYGMVAMFAQKSERSPGDQATVALESLLELPDLAPISDVAGPTGDRWPQTGRREFTLAFSSGTAGRIKCLLMYWPGVQRLVEITRSTFPMSESDRILIALPLSTFQQRYLCYLAIRSGCEVIITTAARYLQSLPAAQPTFILGPPSFYEFAEARHRNSSRLSRRSREVAASLAGVVPSAKVRAAWRRLMFAETHAAFGGRVRLMLIGSAPVRPQLLTFYEKAGFNFLQIYGMTETGYLTWNTPGAHRRGSVGRECYPGSVFLRDGEVLIKHPWHICAGYEGEAAEAAREVYVGDDTIATGDLGEFRDGFLFLRGRKKNVIVTSGGRKLQIEDLESDLGSASGVNRVALFPLGEGAEFSAVVWYQGDPGAAAAAVSQRLQHLGLRLGVQAEVTRAAFVAGDLAPDSPLLNRNLKLNREATKNAMTDRMEPVEWRTA